MSHHYWLSQLWRNDPKLPPTSNTSCLSFHLRILKVIGVLSGSKSWVKIVNKDHMYSDHVSCVSIIAEVICALCGVILRYTVQSKVHMWHDYLTFQRKVYIVLTRCFLVLPGPLVCLSDRYVTLVCDPMYPLMTGWPSSVTVLYPFLPDPRILIERGIITLIVSMN